MYTYNPAKAVILILRRWCKKTKILDVILDTKDIKMEKNWTDYSWITNANLYHHPPSCLVVSSKRRDKMAETKLQLETWKWQVLEIVEMSGMEEYTFCQAERWIKGN